MNEHKTESGNKSISREELKQRLRKLAERDREAVAVFAARCALRVLPLTATDDNFNFLEGNRHEYVQSLFVACTLGLEYDSIELKIRSAVTDAADATHRPYLFVSSTAYTATYAAEAAADAAAAEVAAEAVDAAVGAELHANSAEITAFAAAGPDLIQLEQHEPSLLKNRPLWLNGIPANMKKRIDAWSQAMSALQLDAMAQVYRDLLNGGNYPRKQIQSLINDWYRQYGYKYRKTANEAEPNVETNIKYDQNHASLYDGLAGKDALGRQQLVDAMAAILSARENHQHQTIGLLGDWGAGKSTFVKLLKDKLKEQAETQFLFAELNAWEYEHTDHMQAGVAREALHGLTADLGWWQKWWLAIRLSWQEKPWYLVFIIILILVLIVVLWSANWTEVINALHAGSWESIEFGELFLPGSVSIVAIFFIGNYFQSLHNLFESPLVKQWKRYLTLPDYDAYLGTIPVMKRQIKALCRLRLPDKQHADQKRLLYVVDDLDRCSHAGVVKTLEAVRLIMEIPQVTVIIAIDQRVALASLALHYKDLSQYHTERDPSNIARDYLGKVIQLPVHLYAADAETVASFVDQVLLNEAEAESQAQKPQDTPINPADSLTEGEINDGEDGQNPSQTPSKPSPAKPTVIEKVIYQLSLDEKKAFKQRVERFNFHNPRQLKRLYNSFNLLRHLYGGNQADDHMLVLFWLEYLNNLPPAERKAARIGEVWKMVHKHFEQAEADYDTIEREVKSFVLPALDQPTGTSKNS